MDENKKCCANCELKEKHECILYNRAYHEDDWNWYRDSCTRHKNENKKKKIVIERWIFYINNTYVIMECDTEYRLKLEEGEHIAFKKLDEYEVEIDEN